ncbi:hypothetical protein KAR91_49795 [Candidatus Pacearchaeota archaeon]|nr:hypothetical protein [Candidatus Pacearchaeota archaeon]
MGWLMLVKLLLPMVSKKKTLSFSEAALLQDLVEGVFGLFAKAKRTCVHKTHECTYREGACYILLTKDKDWTLNDINECPYRKLIGRKK